MSAQARFIDDQHGELRPLCRFRPTRESLVGDYVWRFSRYLTQAALSAERAVDGLTIPPWVAE